MVNVNISISEEKYDELKRLQEQYEIDSTDELINLLLDGAICAVTKNKKQLYMYCKDMINIYDDIIISDKYGVEDAGKQKKFFMQIQKLLEQH